MILKGLDVQKPVFWAILGTKMAPKFSNQWAVPTVADRHIFFKFLGVPFCTVKWSIFTMITYETADEQC
jgi:hypothetical protein